MAFLEQPLASLDDYVACFSAQTLPVLKQTNRALEVLAKDLDKLGAKKVAGAVLGDPLMTLRLLTHLQRSRGQRQNRDITTIDRAVMMLGIEPFFAQFSDMPTLELTLAGHPKALVGVLKVIGRARRNTHFARDWAVVRHDLDVDEITVAALLQDATEILCWTFAPSLTQQVYDLQRANRKLRSSVAQRAVFGFTAHEIQASLVRAWGLPELLVNLMDERHADNPRVRNVLLADAFARHSARGWDDPALPDDIDAVQNLLKIKRSVLLQRLGIPPEIRPRFMPPEQESL